MCFVRISRMTEPKCRATSKVDSNKDLLTPKFKLTNNCSCEQAKNREHRLSTGSPKNTKLLKTGTPKTILFRCLGNNYKVQKAELTVGKNKTNLTWRN